MENQNNIELINRAWNRVSPASETCAAECSRASCGDCTCSSKADADFLREAIKTELHDAAYYEVLACRTCSQRAKNIFCRISREEREHAKKLQTEYFLLMCDSCVPPALSPRVPTTLCALRERHLAERKGYDAYIAAAEKTESPELAALYKCHAHDELRHSEEIKALLHCMMN